jgi:hypothetical protein
LLTSVSYTQPIAAAGRMNKALQKGLFVIPSLALKVYLFIYTA